MARNTLTRESFGTLEDGRRVERLTLNGNQLSAAFLTYGATLQALCFNGKDMVLGYDTLEDYVRCGSYLGATVGRYANRIAGGRFMLDGEAYTLACNENGTGHLHGGMSGFDKKVWAAEVLEEPVPAVRFSCVSEDGEEGYPGRLTVTLTVSITDDDALQLHYEARSDKNTVLNLTNHAYFNLNGGDGDVLDTTLQLFSDAITPVDDRLIPTGELLSVDGTPFDFRTAKPIGRDIGDAHAQMRLGGGYDHNFVLGPVGVLRMAAVAHSPRSGITMECVTDEPGVQLYTANWLSTDCGKGGRPLSRHQGFCLETQHYPDTPNHPAFPSARLAAGDRFVSNTLYRFRQD